MATQELSREKELYHMFELDKITKKKIAKLEEIENDNIYFRDLFNILHEEILKESKNRYTEYIIKHTELKNKLKNLIEHKNDYQYKYYIIMLKDITEQMKNNKKLHYGICDTVFRKIGKAKFLIDEDYNYDKKVLKSLNKIRKYIASYYHYCY